MAQAAEPASIIVSLECFYNSSFVFWRQISLPFRAKKLRMSCQYRVRSLGILPEILKKEPAEVRIRKIELAAYLMPLSAL